MLSIQRFAVACVVVLALCSHAMPENVNHYTDDMLQVWLNIAARDKADKLYELCVREARECGAFEKTFSFAEIAQIGRDVDTERVVKTIRDEFGLEVSLTASSLTVSWQGICNVHDSKQKTDLNSEIAKRKQRLKDEHEARVKKQREHEAWVVQTVDSIWHYCLKNMSVNRLSWVIEVEELYGKNKNYKDVIAGLLARGLQIKELPFESGYAYGEGYWSVGYRLQVEFTPPRL